MSFIFIFNRKNQSKWLGQKVNSKRMSHFRYIHADELLNTAARCCRRWWITKTVGVVALERGQLTAAFVAILLFFIMHRVHSLNQIAFFRTFPVLLCYLLVVCVCAFRCCVFIFTSGYFCCFGLCHICFVVRYGTHINWSKAFNFAIKIYENSLNFYINR